jgi:hypothetical protein
MNRKDFLKLLGIGAMTPLFPTTLTTDEKVITPVPTGKTFFLKTEYSPELVQALHDCYGPDVDGLDIDGELEAILRDTISVELGNRRGTLMPYNVISPKTFNPMCAFKFTDDGKNGPENFWGLLP